MRRRVSKFTLCKMKEWKQKKKPIRIQMFYVNTGTRNHFIATAKTRAKIKSHKT